MDCFNSNTSIMLPTAFSRLCDLFKDVSKKWINLKLRYKNWKNISKENYILSLSKIKINIQNMTDTIIKASIYNIISLYFKKEIQGFKASIYNIISLYFK